MGMATAHRPAPQRSRAPTAGLAAEPVSTPPCRAAQPRSWWAPPLHRASPLPPPPSPNPRPLPLLPWIYPSSTTPDPPASLTTRIGHCTSCTSTTTSTHFHLHEKPTLIRYHYMLPLNSYTTICTVYSHVYSTFVC